MNSTYQPQEIETKIYEFWLAHEYFKPSFKGQPYCMMLPPPNVTGSLHMGHGFLVTLSDILIRYHRMMGFNTLWQPGTDHAGIATQMVVERQLLRENKTRLEIGREQFVDAVWKWKEKSGNRIIHQLHRMGVSADWSRTRFTMDEDLSAIVRKVFVDLYREGLIYRGKRLINWDPILRTAISDLEVNNEEEKGYLYYIRYPLVDQSSFLIVATTRPETLFGDTAVAVSPKDARYQKWVGKQVQLPLTQRTIPVIADDQVDATFGSGCLKITPAHDFNDYAIGERHQLPLINILTEDGHLNQKVPSEFQNLDRFDARKKVLEALKAQNLLDHIEDYVVKVPRGDRSKAIIEPFLTDQWFVKMKSLAAPALEAVKTGAIRFIPENWDKTYFQWLESIQDWCVSRQLWWGHRIPAWYDEQGKVYVGMDENEVRSHYQLPKSHLLRQDEDVLDTWFSSALWPFSTLGWPQKTKEFSTFYPTDVLVTGFDIIFFWVARMIMFGLKFTGQVPFKAIYIHGLIRDSQGQKMSKSKGNVIDPLDLIDGIDLDTLLKKRTEGLMQPEMEKKIIASTRKEFPKGISPSGTDALRFTFCALASTGRNINFSFERLEGYRNFCNKIWNAARYIIQKLEQAHIQKVLPLSSIKLETLNSVDRWILSRLHQLIRVTHENLKTYRFDLLAQTLYDFIWHEFCDWYLEFSKIQLNDPNVSEKLKQVTYSVLVATFETVLRLLHPLMPFLTEELWQQSIKSYLELTGSTIMLESYPHYEERFVALNIEKEINWVQQIILSIRNIRGENNIVPNKLIPVQLKKGSEFDIQCVKKYDLFLKNLAKLSDLEWTQEEKMPPSLSAFIGQLEIYIPMKDLIDRDSEISRLKKEISKLEMDSSKIQTRLDSKSFVDKAPREVVEKDRTLLEEYRLTKRRLEEQLKKILSL